MLGNMMQQPLLISSLLTHAERHHGRQDIVSRRVEGDIHRYGYSELAARSRRLANALKGLGIGPSDRVGTLAWNGYRHMELYFAVSGMGAVTHTINPRLHVDQVAWIANHAEDQALFFDLTFLPLVEQVVEKLDTVRTFVLMTDRKHMPVSSQIPNLLCYEELAAGASPDYDWPAFDDDTASSLCYTSGTTGNPKGVLYSHRSTILHAFGMALPDSMGIGACDAVLPVVPMFHVNAWGLPYVGCLVGAKLVYPGPNMDGKSLYELMEAEGVTRASGVPTIWQGLLGHMQQNGLRFSTLERTGIGGSACPASMIRTFQEDYGVRVMHGWGMTETSPLCTVGTLSPKLAGQDAEVRIAKQAKQGRVLFGVDMKIVDEAGAELPWDGKASGELMVRGPWIAAKYFGRDVGPEHSGGWFATGDVSTIDEDGFMHITDRAKDVIKSGGEWISSVELENIAVGHPAVAIAACIGAPHPKWDERPVLFVVRKPGADLCKETLLGFYEGKIAKWWTPDDVLFVDDIPLGPTGKIQKNKLRERFGELAAAARA